MVWKIIELVLWVGVGFLNLINPKKDVDKVNYALTWGALLMYIIADFF